MSGDDRNPHVIFKNNVAHIIYKNEVYCFHTFLGGRLARYRCKDHRGCPAYVKVDLKNNLVVAERLNHNNPIKTIQRLQLLHFSKSVGSTTANNKISSIVEELCEKKLT